MQDDENGAEEEDDDEDANPEDDEEDDEEGETEQPMSLSSCSASDFLNSWLTVIYHFSFPLCPSPR